MPKIIVRSPSDAEVDIAAEIAAKAFPNLMLDHWLESFRSTAEMFGNRYILMAELDGELVSSLVCSSAPVYVNGTPIPHSGVGAIGTIPEKRRSGCAGAMMAECVRVLRDEGIWLSSLWPFSYAYYRKSGWEVGAQVRSYRGEGKFFAEQGDPGKARKGVPEDAQQIKLAFAEFAPCFNGLTERYDEWWERIVLLPRYLGTDFPTHGAVVREDEQGIASYMLYGIDAKEDGTEIEVKESVFSENQHRRDLLALIGSEHPNVTIAFFAPENDLFMHELPNPHGFQTEMRPSFQFRITDPERAMEALPVEEDVEGRITLSIHDPVFEAGFEFGVEADGSGELSICKPQPGRALEMDVMTLAKLYTGYLQPFDALALGRLKVRGDDLTDVLTATQMFSCQPPYRTWLEPG